MSKEIYISSTPHETRLAIVEKDELTEIYYERENEYTLAGSIYNGRVTRVLPGMQSSFVDIGLERDAFLYITDFMEEAGESADFEGAAGPDGTADAGPGKGGSARNGGRPQRGEIRDQAKREDRGREDQNGGGSEPSVEDLSSLAPAGIEGFEPVPGASDSEEIGEGAPGANGSRRWRGRRGRRRGRPGNDGEQGAEAPPAGERSEAAAVQRNVEPEVSADRVPREERREGRNRGGQDRAGERGSDRNGERGGRENRPDGGRERFAARGPRAEFSRAESRLSQDAFGEDRGAGLGAAAEPLILPGESLSKYRRGVPEGAAGEGAAGDSASRSAQKPAVPMLKPKASGEVEPLVGWDGGLVLPGETLSRHRDSNREARPEPSREPRSEARSEHGQRSYDEPGREHSPERSSEHGRDRRRERDARRGNFHDEARRTEFSAAPHSADPAEAVLPAVTSQHEPDATVSLSEQAVELQSAGLEDQIAEIVLAESLLTESLLTADILTVDLLDSQEAAEDAMEEPQTGSAPDVIYEPETDSAPADAAAPAAVTELVEEFHETVAEYEPEEDASASYRVDPLGASEFRQSAPVEEFGALGDIAIEETSEAVVQETSDAAEGAPDHAFTTVQWTGEMLSEIPQPDAGPSQAADSGSSATSPIEHETAVQSMYLEEAQIDAIPFTPQAVSAFSASFEPGDGQLEEELLDEDEGEIGPMQASALGDDMEEETLELIVGHAPDLGSMIRDMSIDEITRSKPVELGEDGDDEDFDIDEEDLEEDELESTGEYELESDEEVSGSLIGEAEEEQTALDESLYEGADEDGAGVAEPGKAEGENEGGERHVGLIRQREGQRHGRRGGRDRGDRAGGGASGQRDRRGTNSRPDGGGRDRGGRSMQATHLPAISDLLKPGQEVLVQIAKEPMAKKGARITSHIALPGRFLVFMPTVSHVGVSRKIESDGERRRLKEILLSEKGEASGGFIVRTAASGASEEDLRSDLRFLLNLWADIKQRSESSKSPALIYHDLNLVERILRDQVTDTFSAIWVDTESEYERVLRFLQRFQPGLIRRVKLYTKDTPLFEQFGLSAEIDKALRSKVWLKSGGSIVINQTEALVAIDINTGKYVGKTARLEDTIVKTNLDAIPEIVRQIRLRDLGGIIIIDFIDMDERKNRSKVMAALEEELKKDRAPSKVLQFNDFGLVAITRKRVKQSLERTLSTTCAVCQGTGMTKSPVTVCNDIYIEMRKMHKAMEKGDIMLRVNPEVVKQLKSGNGKWLQEMEEMSGKTILVKSDPSLHPEQFDIH